MTALPLEMLRSLAAQCGLTVVGVASAEELAGERTFLEAWQDRGMAAEMAFMNRSSDLLTTPERLLPSAKSIVVVALFYDRTPTVRLPTGHGRIARYAWGRDYHKVLRRRLEQLVTRVQEHRGGSVDYRVFSDSVPLLERALAKRAGLGFIGKNTMAIIPKRGSFFFIGEVLWDLEIEGADTAAAPPSHCGSCTNCMTNCPTGAFKAERVLDAGRCISYLTIEKRSALTFEERGWLGEWLFGCDICQEVCPFNFVPLKRSKPADVPELSAQQGLGPTISLKQVLEIKTSEEFRHIFQGTAIMRAKREGLVRNAAIVSANTHSVSLFPLLTSLAITDPSPLVRRHALWASATIASREGADASRQVEAALAKANEDSDAAVREECAMIRSQLREFA